MFGKRTEKDARQAELEIQFEEGLASKYGIIVKRILPIIVLSLVVDVLGARATFSWYSWSLEAEPVSARSQVKAHIGS